MKKEIEKRNILVFDTETVSLVSPLIYNLGYVISNGKETLLERNFLVNKTFNDLLLMSCAFYKNKYPLYKIWIEQKKCKIYSWAAINRKMRQDIARYNVKCLCAYNASFDRRAFEYTNKMLKALPCKKLATNSAPIEDIIPYAENIIKKEDYALFCKKYNFITKKGNNQKTAEVVYRYLKNNVLFTEEHTALSDSEIELEILKHSTYGI